MNYDIHAKRVAELEEHPWKGVVSDEAQVLKNQERQRSKLSRRLVRRQR